MLSLRRSYLRTPQMSVAFNGTISDKSSLQVRVQSAQLHEVEQLADAFLPADSAPLGLYGKATAAAIIRGSTRNPSIRGQLAASDVRLRGTSWKRLRADFAANCSAVHVDGGELISANQGQVTFQLGATLQDWTFSESSPLRVEIAVSGLSAKDLSWQCVCPSGRDVVCASRIQWDPACAHSPAKSSWRTRAWRMNRSTLRSSTLKPMAPRSPPDSKQICPLDQQLPMFVTHPNKRNMTRRFGPWESS